MKELLEGLKIDKKQQLHPATGRAGKGGRRWRLLAIGAAVAIAVAVGSWRVVAASAVPVEVFTVAAAAGQRGSASALTAGGYVRAANVVYVVPKVSGRIAALH